MFNLWRRYRKCIAPNPPVKVQKLDYFISTTASGVIRPNLGISAHVNWLLTLNTFWCIIVGVFSELEISQRRYDDHRWQNPEITADSLFLVLRPSRDNWRYRRGRRDGGRDNISSGWIASETLRRLWFIQKYHFCTHLFVIIICFWPTACFAFIFLSMTSGFSKYLDSVSSESYLRYGEYWMTTIYGDAIGRRSSVGRYGKL